ncbi:hypothetical protein EAI80_00930 [Catenibacterium sp. co_0103]|nr:hypothetical protein EAI80_00930 [Catenibacterium sp. co_0103]
MEVRAVGLVVNHPETYVVEDDGLVQAICLGDFDVKLMLHVGVLLFQIRFLGDGIAALQNAVEDALLLFLESVAKAHRVVVDGDDHGLAGLVTTVDDGVDVFHHVDIGTAVEQRIQALDDEQVAG